MPTGYTECVQSGKVKSLREFALICARGMGACIMMRDDPYDKPIPEEFKPEKYYKESLHEAKQDLEELLALSLAECEQRMLKEYEDSLDGYRKSLTKYRIQKENYEAMIAKVETWTTKAEGIKEFMLSQLKESLEFDDYEPKPPTLQSVGDWRMNNLKSAIQSVEYRQKSYDEEQQRVKDRNRWLKDLRESLPRD